MELIPCRSTSLRLNSWRKSRGGGISRCPCHASDRPDPSTPTLNPPNFNISWGWGTPGPAPGNTSRPYLSAELQVLARTFTTPRRPSRTWACAAAAATGPAVPKAATATHAHSIAPEQSLADCPGQVVGCTPAQPPSANIAHSRKSPSALRSKS